MRNITCGKNDRSKMKDSRIYEKDTVCFYLIATFPTRIELLTSIRKLYESHATVILVFT